MLTTTLTVSEPEYGNPWNDQLGNAEAVQKHLLPRDARLAPNADLSAVCRQANAVGGDFYDFLQLPNGELGIAIGDVAGKGLGAALLMANLQATLRAEARRVPSDLADVITNVNQLFHQACFEEGYATLFYATFDPETRVLKYLNAGHNPPLLRRVDGTFEWLESGGAPVGMFQSWTYTEGSVELNAGDLLVAYTDGVVESQDAFGEQWGAGRLAEILDEYNEDTAARINSEIWNSVERFAGRIPQADDMTLLVVRVS